jgi:hypothetical protein
VTVSVCVLLLWLSSRTVSHVARAPRRTLPITTDVCRGRSLAGRVVWNAPDPPLHGNWQVHKTGRLNEITSSRSSQARESAAFNSTLHFAGATDFTFRTALLSGSGLGKRSMLEPRWRPVQVKVLTSVPSPVRAN